MNRQALDGKEYPETLTRVSNLVLILQCQSKYEEAEQINRRVLESREKMLGKEYPNTLTSVYYLGYLLY